MNSASEAIHYGVPVICLPVQFDQPLVAARLCDELNFGKKLDLLKFTPNQMRNFVNEILNNDKYLENILEFTQISRNKNGSLTGARLISNYLDKF
jgi:zeaxanthin glucosyltransferase